MKLALAQIGLFNRVMLLSIYKRYGKMGFSKATSPTLIVLMESFGKVTCASNIVLTVGTS